jgi:hypothetical protein
MPFRQPSAVSLNVPSQGEDPKNRRFEEGVSRLAAFGGLFLKIKQEKGDQEGGGSPLKNTGWRDRAPRG